MIDFILLEILQYFLDFLRVRNLIQITENNDILICSIFQSTGYCIFLEGISFMSPPLRRIIYYNMYNLILELLEHLFIFFIIKRFLKS